MATRSFLNHDELSEAVERFRPIEEAPQEGVGQINFSQLGREFSLWLGEVLERRLSVLPHWQQAMPVAIGSWARDELCPKSDIDLIFCGPEEDVLALVNEIHEQGLKLRYRVPEDMEDWTQGVGPFDVLAILHARAFDWDTGERLSQQQLLIRERGATFHKLLIQAMVEERKKRNQRYDSISNFLEPNIKYGPGGLRDLQQALYVYELFQEKFVDAHHAIQVLEHYKNFFLSVRQKLHLMGASEVLTATEQLELAQWFGFSDVKAFMREIQIGLSRVSFYAEWVVERARASRPRIKQVESRAIETPSEAFRALKDDSSVLMQGRVRSRVDDLFHRTRMVSRRSLGRHLNQSLSFENSESFFVALFRSRLLEHVVPDLARVKGLVQHDHYHRFTVDAHLLQVLRELKRVHDRPKILGRLGKVAQQLDKSDWKILAWTSIYHDLAKGRGGDHSNKGVELVKRDFVAMSLSLRMTLEVAWLVQHHLSLSIAAFRMNPQAPSTWQSLHEKGVSGKRLLRLAVFTAVDIRATNPEAWTDWKERLLSDLVDSLKSRSATRFMKFLRAADSARLRISRAFVAELDPAIVEAIPGKHLLEDYRALKKSKKDLPAFIIKNRKGETWVRFHRREDRAGLFLYYVQLLYAVGCQIQQSSVRTLPDYGVYDWFQVKTTKSATQMKKLLDLVADTPAKVPAEVYFEKISLVSRDDQSCILSFRGPDQRGLLMAAAKALFELGLEIRWARVHTWGRQIDDVFSVVCEGDIEPSLDQLRTALQRSPDQLHE